MNIIVNKIIVFLYFLIIPITLYSQTQQVLQREIAIKNSKGEIVFTFTANTTDPDMRRIPQNITMFRQNNVNEFIRLLAEYITEKSNNDYERVKKAHDWVALNIRYDTQSFFSGKYSSQEFDAVIKRGNAVCSGYADVFKNICDALKIDCQIVSGYARGYGSNLFNFTNVMNTNHAWNIVVIDEEKYFIDTTWDAGYVNGRNYTAKYRTDYFFPDPKNFIYDHFSYSASTQLLDPPLSAQEFDNLPFINPGFFQAFEVWPNLSRITRNTVGEETNYIFKLYEGYEFSFGWYNSSGGIYGSHTYPPRRGDYKMNIPTRPGKYSLKIFTRKQGENLYWGCAEFGFEVIEKAANDI